MDPEDRLIELAELRPAHLKQHPAWVNCQRLRSGEHLHTFAEATTFHPYTGPLPVNPVNGHNEFYFVRARFTLADGTQTTGMITPAQHGKPDVKAGWGYVLRPYIRVSKKALQPLVVSSYDPEIDRERFYAQLGKRPRDVFPLAVTAEEGLTLGSYRGVLDGFYRVRSTPPYDAECFT